MKIEQIQLTKNKSAFFLTPLTLIPKQYFEKALNHYCLNAHKPELTNHVFVLFDRDIIEEHELRRFEIFSIYRGTEEFDNYILVTFSLLPQFENDYKAFINGKYSKYSDKGKSALKNYLPMLVRDPNTKKEHISNYFKIMYPTNDDRRELGIALCVNLDDDAEIYSSPNLEEETFNINKLYNLFKK